MKKETHPGLTKASNLILIVVVLSMGQLLLPEIHLMTGMIWQFILAKLIFVTLAVLLRLGFRWTKYVLLFFTAWTLTVIPDSFTGLSTNPVSNSMNIISAALLVWATALALRAKGPSDRTS